MYEMRSPEHKVELASPSDFPELCALFDAANTYAAVKAGIPGWLSPDSAYAAIKQHLEANETFIMRAAGGAIGSAISLSETNAAWSAVDQREEVLYFSKYVKHPAKAGPQDPLILLQYMCAEAAQRNKTLIRCNAMADQEGLIRYYHSLGFTNQGLHTHDGGRISILLEVSAADLAMKIDYLLNQ
jgi:hypothetical protein